MDKMVPVFCTGLYQNGPTFSSLRQHSPCLKMPTIIKYAACSYSIASYIGIRILYKTTGKGKFASNFSTIALKSSKRISLLFTETCRNSIPQWESSQICSLFSFLFNC